MAEGDVKLPVFGEVPKKYAVGGIVVGVAVVGVIIMRNRSKSAGSTGSGTSSASSGMITDPAGNVCAALDPNSGYCPGSPEDQQYQSDAGLQGISSYGGDPYAGYGYGGYGGYGGSGGMGSPTGTQPATNEQWVEEAIGTVPGNASAIRTALERVLAGLTVTTAQKDLFLEAAGINGQPPGGYPQPIKTSDTAGHPGTIKVRVPSLIGRPQEDAFALVTEAGLKPHGSKTVKGKVLRVVSQSPKAGSEVRRGSIVNMTSR